MGKEVVVTGTLTEELIDAGAAVIHALDTAHFNVQAALWIYEPEIRRWRLLIASPKVKLQGPFQAYEQIQKALAKIQKKTSAISIQDIFVVDTKHPFISLLGTAISTGPGISGIRFSQNMIDGVFIEDAYIYRLT